MSSSRYNGLVGAQSKHWL
ncbi:hypothetical protein A2U01_0098855, partial [Trifolium medium]|nr:hypothetical protein [Trifolium medium]